MFLNGYIQTPNTHHFKGFAIKILQYEMKKCLKVITKAEGLILFTTNFYGTDVNYHLLKFFKAENMY